MNVFLQRQGDFWSKLLNSSGTKDESRAHHNKFSFEELEKLYDVLEKNPVVSEANKSLVVETIRNVAEFLIWGDQNEPRVFDFFLENNILAYLHRCE
jgi:protein CLEC16A